MGISLRLIVILAFCLACTVVLSQAALSEDGDLGELVEQPLGLTPALDPDLVHEFQFRLGKVGRRRRVRKSRRIRRKPRKARKKKAGGEKAEEEKAGGENVEEEKAGSENGGGQEAGAERNGGGQAAGAAQNGGCATLFNSEAMFCCRNPRKCYRGENALATCKKNCIG